MVTQNYENVLAMMLLASSTVKGLLRITTVQGMTRYLSNKFTGTTAFPYGKTESMTTSATAAGISIGSGNTAATKQDYNLEHTITGGVSMSITSISLFADEHANPTLRFKITVTNTGSSEITVREIGYKQKLAAIAAPNLTAEESGNANPYVCLIDRTILNTPLTLQAGDAGVIVYDLCTEYTPREKAGVVLVPFTTGSDEEICAMIDAAQNGLIDLQADGGWQIGDARTIHLNAFTGGGSVSHAARDIDIVITQFGDYNECGSVLQFDFAEPVTTTQRMAPTNTNVGGYGATEMYTTTLPAMVEALPEWLQTRLKTFSVLTRAGNQSTEIVSVANNKLALRSYAEIFGGSSGEGTRAEWYKRTEYNRRKTSSRAIGSTSSSEKYWLRSPNAANSSEFLAVQGDGSYTSATASTTGVYYIAPFGCV